LELDFGLGIRMISVLGQEMTFFNQSQTTYCVEIYADDTCRPSFMQFTQMLHNVDSINH